MYREILTIEELENNNIESSTTTGFHPIVAFYEYDDIDSDIETDDCIENSAYCFPILISSKIEDF